MKTIKFYNADRFYLKHKDEILTLTNEVFSSGQVVEGMYVKYSEEQLASLTNRRNAVLVNSCTDALFFSLVAAGIKKGDEILVPAFSFIASASAVLRAGATPVFVDVNEDGLINLDFAAKKITNNTKAIIPVHIFGRMVNPAELNSFSEKYHLQIIEDAAQALGSKNKNIPAGKTGIASCFSFDPSKIIHSFGTAGVVVTDNSEIADKIRSIRVHGKSTLSQDIDTLGYNSRIPSIQAAILHLQLTKLNEIVSKRKEIANNYYSKLNHIKGLRTITPDKEEIWNYHKFPVFTEYRDELKTFLTLNNIETGIHYQKTLPEHSLFGMSGNYYTIAKLLSQTELSLPIYPELGNDEINWICDCIVKFFNSKGLC